MFCCLLHGPSSSTDCSITNRSAANRFGFILLRQLSAFITASTTVTVTAITAVAAIAAIAAITAAVIISSLLLS